MVAARVMSWFVIPSGARHSSPSHGFCAMNLLSPAVPGFTLVAQGESSRFTHPPFSGGSRAAILLHPPGEKSGPSSLSSCCRNFSSAQASIIDAKGVVNSWRADLADWPKCECETAPRRRNFFEQGRLHIRSEQSRRSDRRFARFRDQTSIS